MYRSLKKRAAVSALCLFGLAACSNEAEVSTEAATEMTTEIATEPENTELAANLEYAEGMIDAFYSFDASRLESFLTEAGDSKAGLLGYQASAEGGNYKVLVRPPCALEEEGGTIVCPVTVQDDRVQALETGFDVTDTFHLTFEDGVIVNVDTSSNDQPIYRDAGVWVRPNPHSGIAVNGLVIGAGIDVHNNAIFKCQVKGIRHIEPCLKSLHSIILHCYGADYRAPFFFKSTRRTNQYLVIAPFSRGLITKETRLGITRLSEK